MTADDFARNVDQVRTLLREKLGARGKTLARQLKRAGRQLPRRVRRDGAYLVEVEGLQAHPKLSRMVDQQKVASAHRSLVEFLEPIDPKERRKDRILSILGLIAFNLLVLGIGIVFWMWWTGRV